MLCVVMLIVVYAERWACFNVMLSVAAPTQKPNFVRFFSFRKFILFCLKFEKKNLNYYCSLVIVLIISLLREGEQL
jgi:hypothetical protein